MPAAIRTSRYVLVAAAALLALSAAEGADSDPGARGLFFDVPAPKLNVTVRPTVSRRRVVTVDIAALRAQKKELARLPFNLFSDAAYEGVVEQVIERGADDFTLEGTLNGEKNSSFSLVVKGGVAVMNIRTANRGMFHLRYLGNSFYDVRQIDERQYPPCATTAKHAIAAPVDPAPARAKAAGSDLDSAATIDVMVVYTPASRIAAGGTDAMEALINLAVDESNTAYQRSQVTTRLRLVYQQEVAYTESGSFDTDLTRLTGTSDGYLDQVHTLRNTYGADLVCMLIDNSDFCGLGWLMTTLSSGFAASAFSTVDWDCATGNYTFAHELAHNMGCAHDRENATGAGLYSYSYGWRFTPAGDVQKRTIMAYSPGERIQNFSNPNVLYNGAPTGVPAGQLGAADNARTINNSALTVANWRQSVPQCGFGLSHSTTNVSSAPVLCTVHVVASNICAWTATSQSAFLSITNSSSGTGDGKVTLAVATNDTFSARTGTVMIAGRTFTVTQNGALCAYALSHYITNFPSLGGTGTLAVASQTGCLWTAVSQNAFIAVTNTGTGSGDGSITFSVAPNDSFSIRTGTVLVADQTLMVVQAGNVQAEIVLSGGNDVQLEFRGPPATLLVVEESMDLVSWSPAITNVLDAGGVWTLIRPLADTSRRFYRAVIH